MAKRFNARRAGEYRAFLKAHDFFCLNKHSDGDDDIYERSGYGFTVKIPSRESEEVPTGTALYITRCIQKMGGFSKKDILRWWKDNGFGE